MVTVAAVTRIRKPDRGRFLEGFEHHRQHSGRKGRFCAILENKTKGREHLRVREVRKRNGRWGGKVPQVVAAMWQEGTTESGGRKEGPDARGRGMGTRVGGADACGRGAGGTLVGGVWGHLWAGREDTWAGQWVRGRGRSLLRNWAAFSGSEPENLRTWQSQANSRRREFSSHRRLDGCQDRKKPSWRGASG